VRLIDLNTVLEEIEDTVTSVSFCGTVEAARSAHETKDRILSRVKDLPTIEAVPLDKLCEWLAANASYIFGGYKNTWKFEARHWKDVLTKWMEEQDAAD
jgi:hypothetical protein